MALITEDSPDQGKKKQRRKVERYQEDFRWLMSTERGRRLMWQWLGEANVFQTSVRSSDPNSVFFNEGMRNMGLLRINDINNLCPNDYLQMVKESQDEV